MKGGEGGEGGCVTGGGVSWVEVGLTGRGIAEGETETEIERLTSLALGNEVLWMCVFVYMWVYLYMYVCMYGRTYGSVHVPTQ